MNQTKEAILYFARTVKAEAKIKSLVGNGALTRNQIILKSMDRYVLQLTKSTGIDTFQSNENNQSGNGFGEKYCNSIQELFCKGYKRIVIIGNDCLRLQSQDIQDAFKKLENHQMVIGPTSKGGFYLMGITPEAFYKNQLVNLPWQTADLLDALYQNLTLLNIKAFITTCKDDVNNAEDLNKAILKVDNPSKLINALISLLRKVTPPEFRSKLYIQFLSYRSLFFRGPPPLYS